MSGSPLCSPLGSPFDMRVIERELVSEWVSGFVVSLLGK